MSAYPIIKEAIRRYQKSPKGKTALQAANRKYYLRNLESFKEKNRRYKLKLKGLSI